MRTIDVRYNPNEPAGAVETTPCAATIGHFDGVHLGHRYVLAQLSKAAEAAGLQSRMVVTFDRHPRSLFDETYQPRLLTTIGERQKLLADCGVDACAILQFDRTMAAMTAYEFMKEILRDRLGVRLLMLGYDNRFGKRQPGEGFDDYVEYGKQLGIKVMPCDAYRLDDGTAVSSTLIRSLLEQGFTDKAEALMRP